MSGLTTPLRDSELAGLLARKFFGKFGMARIKTIHTRKLNRDYEMFQVGVVAPDGDWIVKGEASFDFDEAFQNAGKYVEASDNVVLRYQVAKLAKAEEPKPEQVEMFA